MTENPLLRRRLSQYAQAWLAAYVLALIGTLGPSLLLGAPFIRMADIMLSVTFVLVAVVMLAFFAATAVARISTGAKALLFALGVLLTLPLFWSPVLGVVTGAWASKVSIEYSAVYAGFRILVGNVLYDVTEVIFGNPLVEAAWTFFQGFATVVGVFSGLLQIWNFLQRPAAPVVEVE